MAVKYSRGKLPQYKFAVVVDNGVSRVGAALKPHHHVRFGSKQIRYFSLALVAEAAACYCSYHKKYLPIVIFKA